MRSKSKLWISLVVILGIATGFLVYRYLSDIQAGDQADVAMTAQVVAKVRIQAGSKIAADMLDVTKVPAQYAHQSALSDPKAAVNLFAVADMVPGEIILTSKVSSEKITGELPYRVPEGYRAVTVPVDSLTGVAGQVKPGHYVDVLAVYKASEKMVDSRVHTILQRVLVLAVGLDLQKKDDAQVADTVTLAVTPNDAQTVVLANNIGRVALTLRPAGDESRPPLQAMDLARLQMLYP